MHSVSLLSYLCVTHILNCPDKYLICRNISSDRLSRKNLQIFLKTLQLITSLSHKALLSGLQKNVCKEGKVGEAKCHMASQWQLWTCERLALQVLVEWMSKKNILEVFTIHAACCSFIAEAVHHLSINPGFQCRHICIQGNAPTTGKSSDVCLYVYCSHCVNRLAVIYNDATREFLFKCVFQHKWTHMWGCDKQPYV